MDSDLENQSREKELSQMRVSANRQEFINNLSKQGLDETIQNEFIEFNKQNENLTENEFYTKFNETFTWIDLVLKYQNGINLKKIENHLFFFKIVTIISIILSIVVIVFFSDLF